MTDKEKLLALLAEFGLDYVSDQPSDVMLVAGHGNVGGYKGFSADFVFDDDGKFVSVGVWE